MVPRLLGLASEQKSPRLLVSLRSLLREQAKRAKSPRVSGVREFPYETPAGSALLLVEELGLLRPFCEWFEAQRDRSYAFLLDSARLMPGLARYSFLGADPWLVFTARTAAAGAALAEIELRYFDPERPGTAGRLERRCGDPFVELERQLAQLHMPRELRAELALPLLSGAVGFFSYDAAALIERLPNLAPRALDVPELCFLFVDQLLAHDHDTGCTTLLTTGRGSRASEAQQRARRSHAAYRSQLPWRRRIEAPQPLEPAAAQRVHSAGSRDAERDYRALVGRAREHIAAGDVFEVCTTYRVERAFAGDPWQLYCSLRAINPAPFACFLQLPELVLASSSPERFLRASWDGLAETRPIKGTRPRGQTPAEDARLRAELAGSEKDRAEHLMIVDLSRNDLGRVCEIGSIRVPELMIVEDHPSVFQMVSTVRGRLAEGRSALQLLRACFPPGSMTGAPKVEAMKIIERLEAEKRGLYAGSVGYFDAGGGMDFNVVIRSFVLQGGRCSFNVGGAIVADSNPGDEYAETLAKGRALIAALEWTERRT